MGAGRQALPSASAKEQKAFRNMRSFIKEAHIPFPFDGNI